MKIQNIGYMSIPKNAHTSISNMLPMFTNFPEFDDEWLEIGKHYSLKKKNKLYSFDFLFASIRNPYDRFLSSYNECKKYGYNKNVFCFADDFKTKNLSTIQIWHTQPQTFHLLIEDIKFLIRVENIMEDINKLCNLLNIERKRKIVHDNRSTKKEFIDNDIKRLVHDIYEEDFDILGY